MSPAVSAWLSPSINMHHHNTPLRFIGLLSFAYFALLACLAILGMRGDGERIIFPDDQHSELNAEIQELNTDSINQLPNTQIQKWTNASFDAPVNSKISIFLCAPEQNKADLEALSQMNIQTIDNNGVLKAIDPIALDAPMPLEIPDDFAQKHALSTRVFCNGSEIIHLDNSKTESNLPAQVSTTRQIAIPDKAFAVAAISDPGNLYFEKLLFFFFLIALWSGIALFSRQFRLNTCHFKRYDFLLAFGGGNVLALLLLEAISFLPFEKNSLLPGYGEMLTMLIVNFAGFLLTAIFFVWLRQPKHTPWFRAISFASNIQRPSTIATTPADSDESEYNPSDEALSLHDNKDNPSSQTQVNSESEKTSSKEALVLQKPDVPVKLIYPLISGVLLAIAGSIVVLILVKQPGLTTFTMASQLVSTLFLTGFFALLAAISEESIFRGIIQSSLEARQDSANPMLTNAIAIAITSVLFVGMHVLQSLDHLWALVPIAAVSITSGILKIHYRTIFPCILLHMTYNATLVVPGILIA